VTNNTFKTTAAETENLKEALIDTCQKSKLLLTVTSHWRFLQLEKIRIEKALLSEKSKVRVLEDELEIPRNVHRWRFLEGSNPSLLQMLRMIIKLRDSGMISLSKMERLRYKIKTLKRKLQHKLDHLTHTTHQDHKNAIDFFHNELAEKDHVLSYICKMTDQQKATVGEKKDSVNKVREELRDTKQSVFLIQRRAINLRKSFNEAAPDGSDDGPRPKFIGGGFAVKGSTKNTIVRYSSLLPKQCVIPKVNSEVGRSINQTHKMLAKGWNPSRKPLQPLLPTVTVH
jgi:hypothetical protein